MKRYLLLFVLVLAIVMAGTAAFAVEEEVWLEVGHSSEVFLVRNEAGKMVTNYHAGTNTPKALEDLWKAYMNHRHFNRALYPEEMKMVNDKSIFNAHYGGMWLNASTSGDITLDFKADTALITNSPVTQWRNSHKVFKQGAHDFKVLYTGYYRMWYYDYGENNSIVNEHGLQYELKEGAETSLSEREFTFKTAGGRTIEREFPKIQTTEAQMKIAVPYIELTTSGSGENEVVTGFTVKFVDPEDKDRNAFNVTTLGLEHWGYRINVHKEYRNENGMVDYIYSNNDFSGAWIDTVTIGSFDEEYNFSEKSIPLSKFNGIRIYLKAIDPDDTDNVNLMASYEWSFVNSEQELDFDELQDAWLNDFSDDEIVTIQTAAQGKFIGANNNIKKNVSQGGNSDVEVDMTTKFPAIRDGLGLNSARVSTAIWIPGTAVDNEGDALGVGRPRFPINPTNSAGDRRIGTEIENNEIDKIKQYYSVKKYFVTYDSSGNVERTGKHVDLLDKFGDKVFDFTLYQGVIFKAGLVIVDNTVESVVGLDAIDPADKWQDGPYGAVLYVGQGEGPDDNVLFIYDGRANKKIEDPIVLESKGGSGGGGGSGCNASGFAGFALLLAAAAIHTARRKKD